MNIRKISLSIIILTILNSCNNHSDKTFKLELIPVYTRLETHSKIKIADSLVKNYFNETDLDSINFLIKFGYLSPDNTNFNYEKNENPLLYRITRIAHVDTIEKYPHLNQSFYGLVSIKDTSFINFSLNKISSKLNSDSFKFIYVTSKRKDYLKIALLDKKNIKKIYDSKQTKIKLIRSNSILNQLSYFTDDKSNLDYDLIAINENFKYSNNLLAILKVKNNEFYSRFIYDDTIYFENIGNKKLIEKSEFLKNLEFN